MGLVGHPDRRHRRDEIMVSKSFATSVHSSSSIIIILSNKPHNVLPESSTMIRMAQSTVSQRGAFHAKPLFRSKLLWFTAAAAFSTLSGSSHLVAAFTAVTTNGLAPRPTVWHQAKTKVCSDPKYQPRPLSFTHRTLLLSLLRKPTYASRRLRNQA